MRLPAVISIVIALLAVTVPFIYIDSAEPLGYDSLVLVGRGLLIGLSIPPFGIAVAIYGLVKDKRSKGCAAGLFINVLLVIVIIRFLRS